MKNLKLHYLVYKMYPLIIMSSVILFIILFILGFCLSNQNVKNILFGISFLSLILYIPSFILISKLQNVKWFKMFTRCEHIKALKKQNLEKLKKEAEALLKEYGVN